jgi:hypothetical protein
MNDTQKRIRALGGKLVRKDKRHLVYELPNGRLYTVCRGTRVDWRAVRSLRSLARKPARKGGRQ